MAQIGVNWIATIATTPGSSSPLLSSLSERLERRIQIVEDHLEKATYFAGTEFTAADIMMHFPFGTMKAFYNVGLDNRPNIKAWLARISERPLFQRAPESGWALP